MARQNPAESLYRQTMEAARSEVQELTLEIRHLRSRLAQLETQKEAVSHVYNSVRRLVELTHPALSESDPDGAYEAIGLSEEEVSLIAYPDGNGRTA